MKFDELGLKTNDLIKTKMGGFSTNGFYFNKGIKFKIVVNKELFVFCDKINILREIVPGIGLTTTITIEQYKTWFEKV